MFTLQIKIDMEFCHKNTFYSAYFKQQIECFIYRLLFHKLQENKLYSSGEKCLDHFLQP